MKYGHLTLAKKALNELCVLLDTDKKNGQELETIRKKLVKMIPTNLGEFQRVTIENEVNSIKGKAAENIVVFKLSPIEHGG